MTVTTLNPDGLLVGAEDTICTYTGRWIRPLDPDPNLIDIEDIGHALSNVCRFTGHVSEFYSVAEHCVLASYIVPEADAFEALLHDASEAYLSDLARPIKKAPGLGEIYRAAEEQLERAIAEAFIFPWPMSETVREADFQMLASEVHYLMPETFREGFPAPAPSTPRPACWSPKRARRLFLKRFEEVA